MEMDTPNNSVVISYSHESAENTRLFNKDKHGHEFSPQSCMHFRIYCTGNLKVLVTFPFKSVLNFLISHSRVLYKKYCRSYDISLWIVPRVWIYSTRMRAQTPTILSGTAIADLSKPENEIQNNVLQRWPAGELKNEKMVKIEREDVELWAIEVVWNVPHDKMKNAVLS